MLLATFSCPMVIRWNDKFIIKCAVSATLEMPTTYIFARMCVLFTINDSNVAGNLMENERKKIVCSSSSDDTPLRIIRIFFIRSSYKSPMFTSTFRHIQSGFGSVGRTRCFDMNSLHLKSTNRTDFTLECVKIAERYGHDGGAHSHFIYDGW